MAAAAKAAILFGLSLTLSGESLLAQQFKVALDENGNAICNGVRLGFTMGPDPTGLVAGNVLMYSLPFDVQPGLVGFTEPNSPNAPLSDVIRFYENFPGGRSSLLIVYSDQEAGEPNSLADVGIPPVPVSVTIAETGPEGNNGGVYVAPFPGPGAGTPLLGGPVTGSASYDLISDGTLSVPEGGSALLLPAAAVVLFGTRRFFWKEPERSGPALV